MIGERTPLFSSGTVLTKDMLESIKNYAVAESENAYIGYSDGIYSGCEITATDDMLTVNRGIFIYNERAYYIDKPMSVKYVPTNEWMIFKINFVGEEVSATYITREIKVCLGREQELGSNDIELCRFKLQSGARLRSVYRGYGDLNTQYDTIYVIHAKWSAYGKSSLSPVILKEFYREAIKLPGREMIDKMFLHQIIELRGNTLNRDTIQLYISEKLGWEYKDYPDEKLYEGLNEALRGMRNGRSNTMIREQRERRIIVD